MSKKILIDARMYGLEHTGIGRYLVNLIEQLSKSEFKVKFVILLRRKYFEELSLPKNWHKVLADYRHYSIGEQLFLPALINSEKPDLVHFPHLNIPLFWNGNFVVTIHDLTMQRQKKDASTLPTVLYYLTWYPFLFIAYRAAIKSTKIIAPSNYVRQDLVKYYHLDANKIKVVNEGISLQSKKQNTSQKNYFEELKIKQPYFLIVGNAYPHKNISKVIEATILLNENSKTKTSLVVVGAKGEFAERLKKTVNALNAINYIEILGFVDDKYLPSLYYKSSAYIYPSLTEGFGLQGLEAMENETLVLASNIPVFKEIYRDNVLYFDPKNVESLKKAMLDVLNMKISEKISKIKRAKEFINRYSWSKMAKETLRVYNEALQSTKSR